MLLQDIDYSFLCYTGGARWLSILSIVKSLSRVRLFVTPWAVACTRVLRPWDFLGKSTGVGCHFLLQGIFPTQGWNPDLLHCRQTLYHLSHQGNYLTSRRKTPLKCCQVHLSTEITLKSLNITEP